MLELSGVSKAFGRLVAIRPLDLLIPPEQTTVLIGPSGSGKSTLLRLMIGLATPDTGTVSIGGTRVTRETVRELRRKLGYVIQEGGLFPHLTARANVTLLARTLGRDPGWMGERLSELCRLTHFPEDAMHRFPLELSGGQRQRVSLMRALMLDPDVLLLDEPLGALDPMIRAELQSELREIFRSLKKTVVLVTHDMGEAALLGDDIVLLRDGAIVQRGRIEDLLGRPADPFVTAFIGAQRSPLDDLARRNEP
ncbi:MAG: ATP-binding cassette domain-containing protein [Candidatus Eisenbacteria bacterium]|nr:ATP-binding cassette domain-containing protein [Candidatus Eisenbacteria bacterium]